MYRRKEESRHSSFVKNGEDIEFEDPGFHALAYGIAQGPHEFSYTLTNAGLELTFASDSYILEVLFENEHRWLRGRALLTPRRG
ncbi:hypothetical protein GCM10023188_25600 [Pontibacter saemangeumensis]|uniref:Uncharacterized protein n=1 Tax=Pontibacter saemangeumensis TaxID=1084525 RepID=A0ABP8LT19_9BACT